MRSLLIILINSTALASSPVLAQAPQPTSKAETPRAATQTATIADCDRLTMVLEQRHPANPGVTIEQVRTYKSDNNAEACREALVRIDASATQANQAEGATNIVVQQAAPDVKVEQASPQVTVQQAQPQVTVHQPQPDITVRQPAPTITVEIPQPEITVRMPKPEVNVAMVQPQVQVTQPPPQVQVTQPQQPQVQVQPAQPKVNVEQAGNSPKVEVQENAGQPTVHYERAEPRVVVNQPQRQPQIHVEQGDNGSPRAGEQSATTGSVSNAGQGIAASRLKNMELYNEHGDRLGVVERVIQSNAGKHEIVIGKGGFLGLGEKRIAIPVEDVRLSGGRLVAQGLTDDQLKQMPAFETNSRQFRDLDGNATVQLSLR